jgi:predicted dinucleotide-binding enzyme
MKIGIVGTGMIGSSLAKLWAEAGHEVFISSRNPKKLTELAKEIGEKTRIGLPEEAAQFAEVILLSIPMKGFVDLSDELKKSLKGKIVLDTSNPYPERDGEIANTVMKDKGGSGSWVANQLPDAKTVKAFNTVYFQHLREFAHSETKKIGIPLASDDKAAMKIAAQLVKDSGFVPVEVGAMARSKDFDAGTKIYATSATPEQIRAELKL